MNLRRLERLGRTYIGMLLGFLFVLGNSALSRPVIIEESAKVMLPANERPVAVAIDGDDLFVLTSFPDDIVTHPYNLRHFQHRDDGEWASLGVIAQPGQEHDFYNRVWLEVQDGIGALSGGGDNPLLLERTTSGWRAFAAPTPRGTRSNVSIYGRTIAIGGTDSGRSRSLIHLLEHRGVGDWVLAQTVEGPWAEPDSDFLGPNVTLAQAELAAGNEIEPYEYQGYMTQIFDRVGDEWQLTWTLDTPLDTYVINGRLARRQGYGAVPGDIATFHTRDAWGSFQRRHSLLSDEWFGHRQPAKVVFKENLAIAAAPQDDARGSNAGSITVLRYDWGQFMHVATLMASDGLPGQGLSLHLATDGRRVVATTRDVDAHNRRSVYVFDLADPLPSATRLQDTFEDRNFAGWSPWGLANWQVVGSAGTQVFRQTNTQGDARAIFDEFESDNQSIEADVRINSGPATRWAGLMARYVDASNFYYLMNGRNNTLEIRRILNGAFGPLASTPFTMEVGRAYRFRLEAIGEWLRGYVNGRLMLEVRDTTHPRGRTGLTMWKADAQYDNVVVTTNPQTVLHADSFAGTEEENQSPWTIGAENVWSRVKTAAGPSVFRQWQPTGDARAVNGGLAEDQIISATIVQPTAGQGWAGLMARYVDDSQYYYVFLKDSEDKISLRRLTDGQITVLDEAPMTVTPGTPYHLRFEATGSSLRVYVNNRLRLEAEDSTIPMGQYGLVTFRASADFDNFRVVRP